MFARVKHILFIVVSQTNCRYENIVSGIFYRTPPMHFQ